MKKAVFFVIIALIAISCSKYEEGRASFASKKSRLVNLWKTTKVTRNDVDATDFSLVTQLYIREDNKIIFSGEQGVYFPNKSGVWEFDSDKSHVIVTFDDGSVVYYEIIRLEKDSFKIKNTDTYGDVYLFEFEPYS